MDNKIDPATHAPATPTARLVSAPADVYLLTDDGREVHVGEEIPCECQFFYVVGPCPSTGMTIAVPQE